MVIGRSLRHEFSGGQGWVTRRCGESTRIASETTQKQPCWRLQQHARMESTAPDQTGPDHRGLLRGSDETILCFKFWYRNRGQTERVAVRAVAAEAGLSIATVSRVLNGGGHVAPRTREREREVVDRLGDGARGG